MAVAIAATAVVASSGTALGMALTTGHAGPRSCTFDGGGTIASGDAARTTEGTEWVCTDGTLIRIKDYGNAS